MELLNRNRRDRADISFNYLPTAANPLFPQYFVAETAIRFSPLTISANKDLVRNAYTRKFGARNCEFG
jgi:hypothetical protein